MSDSSFILAKKTWDTIISVSAELNKCDIDAFNIKNSFFANGIICSKTFTNKETDSAYKLIGKEVEGIDGFCIARYVGVLQEIKGKVLPYRVDNLWFKYIRPIVKE